MVNRGGRPDRGEAWAGMGGVAVGDWPWRQAAAGTPEPINGKQRGKRATNTSKRIRGIIITIWLIATTLAEAFTKHCRLV